ncbi:RND family efflux transporter MFP subunit [Anseongella ginsenosidimutans]|uniref:RND family efflux transporter MFP subunit n=1 Tax=Anseongella ginsenosidimutans TaxID=496056 RepID=A0A4V2UT55_9SPHI|nr:efflux RND transporter periplasmic adaptor subunit [Anseongella ginsenosidimutans]TCS84249.1 RND family efflux transporter MFP subunit [Anseongella ginsenosidimutans]
MKTRRALFSNYLYIVIISAVSSCQTLSSKEAGEEAIGDSSSSLLENTLEEPSVRFASVELHTFNKELKSNGTVSATRKAVVAFRQEGTIQDIYVKEGDRVNKGQKLAAIEQETYHRNLAQKKLQLTKARLDFEDLLLRMGYKLKDTAELDREVSQMARIRSGLGQALYDLELAEEELANTVVTAPFSGLIADVQARPYNSTSVAGGRLCTLIDNNNLTVEFPVLESELAFIRKSGRITVSLFNNKEKIYPGRVTSINPRVDNNGMVQVQAFIDNTDNQLLDGMNVRVSINQSVADQLVVPKEAVLDRQGRKVVFTYEDSVAKWNYVEIGLENGTQYTITSGLEPGDMVIYEGNFNLAHDKPVQVKTPGE